MGNFSLLMAALLAGSFVQEAPDPAKIKVSYTTEGASVNRALQDIATKTGLQLSADVSFRELPLVIDVKDGNGKELLDRIAEATHGAWFQTKDGLRLKQSTDRDRLDLAAHQARLIRVYGTAIDKARKDIESFKPLDADSAALLAGSLAKIARSEPNTPYQVVDKLGSQLPGTKLAKRLMASFKPEFYASLPQDGRTVLARQPNRMQKQMPATADSAINEFMQEQSVWVNALARESVPDQFQSGRNANALRLLLNPFRPQEGKTKLLVVLRPSTTIASLEVLSVDTSGQSFVIGSTYVILNSGEGIKLEAPASTEKPTTLEMLQKEYVDGLTQLRRGSDSEETKALSPELIKALLNPERNDPWTLGPGKGLIEAARAQGLQLVCSPPDGLLSEVAEGLRESYKPTDIFNIALSKSNFGVVSQVNDGWWCVKWDPHSNPDSYPRPMPRTLMGKALRSMKASGTVLLDSLAEFASQPRCSENFCIFTALMLFEPELFGMSYDDNNRFYLRIHRSLSIDQRTELFGGGSVSSTVLSSEAIEAVRALVFEQRALEFKDQPLPDLQEGALRNLGIGSRLEPTEIFPDGLPKDLRLTAPAKSMPVLATKVRFDSGYQTIGRQTFESYAEQIVRLERPNAPPQTNQLLGMRPLQSTSFLYRIELEKSLYSSGTLTELRQLGPWAPNIDGLSRSVRAAFDQVLELVRKKAKPPAQVTI